MKCKQESIKKRTMTTPLVASRFKDHFIAICINCFRQLRYDEKERFSQFSQHTRLLIFSDGKINQKFQLFTKSENSWKISFFFLGHCYTLFMYVNKRLIVERLFRKSRGPAFELFPRTNNNASKFGNRRYIEETTVLNSILGFIPYWEYTFKNRKFGNKIL